MKILSFSLFILGGFLLYLSAAHFRNYLKTHEDTAKYNSLGFLISSLGFLLLAYENMLSNPSGSTELIGYVFILVGMFLKDKAKRSSIEYVVPERVVNSPLSNIIIFLIVGFLLINIYSMISMRSIQENLINKGRVIPAVVVDKFRQGSSYVIYYQFIDNGRWVRESELVNGLIKGRPVGLLKRGDKIDILSYNGHNIINGSIEQGKSKLMDPIVIGLILVLVGVILRRFNIF